MLPPKLERTAEFGWPTGDAPGRPEFHHPVEANLADALRLTVEQLFELPAAHGGSVTALAPHKGAIGRYRVETGGQAYFVRVTLRWGHAALESELCRWLAAHSQATTSTAVVGHEFSFEGGRYRLDAREMWEARHFEGAPSDLQRLAHTLQECHAILAQFPGVAEVQRLSAARFARLQATVEAMRPLVASQAWDRLCADPTWGQRHREWLEAIVAQADLRFDLEPGAQCLHAQVHRGNVLFRLADGSPVLIDFEDAPHTYAVPEWDTAHLLQRFCMHDNPTPTELRERVAVVREAYGQPLGDVALMMRRVAWFSIAILVNDHLQDGVSAPVAEYEKFVRLERQAQEYEEVLRAL